ncbi:isoleucine--tRNA ligase [Anaerocolumna cellulosilytica]|uniref:Isoleucine--tRNA ligase n=1 Tax=Anaerocolumna cellulosilytica TaxID=433286 RepID=A0A6S6QZI3_9FIRM|nr:isoleucine--tRNA ligase [Anaerocolumna cellulosilytica]MBB5196170.1 isoleucyl-tRNA synthetase [Anaerocolumna cellulosilytica]BCJ92510.1 isoleucine--tRNA ligase [Anaerocolumna cellulosilytica]
MYDKVSTNLNFVEREKEVLKFWKNNKIFEKTIEERKNGKPYTFYDGPPTANGKPHIGHVLTRVIKDIIPRYRTMKGYDVLRKAGWDTHGLPVELEVEKKLGLDGKEQIEEYGLEPFIHECKESVWKYKGMWEDFSGTVGYWADMDNPYVTYENDFIESEWWALKQIWEKGLLYKGFKIVPYCPRCGTPLSSHEVAQGYKDVKEKSVIAKFKVKDTENEYILAWTTTPWTLPSNVGLCVNPKETYVKAEVQLNAKGDIIKEDSEDKTPVRTEKYILAEALLSVIEGNYTVLKTYVGTDLEYKEYEPLFNYVTPDKKAYFVTCDTYVTLTDGTGVVHIAPAFGEDDASVGRKYDLPFVQLVDGKGEMKPEVTDFAGMFCKKADEGIIKLLASKGLLFKTLKFEHSYPFCWRCDTPLIYYARESWFVKMTDVKEKLIANNNTINWMPESIGQGRFGDWLKNVQDWGISRDRYWGTPLNIWECEDGHRHAIGSIEELRAMSDNCPEKIELHRPFIDEVTIKCPECGKQMQRVKPVIDCWFDSGSMPFAQWHYPFENKEIFERNFPADFISEAVDQTRGWFYSLLAISTLIFDRAPFKNVIVLGHVQDENGQKMSKSKGNAVDPFDALSEHGADAIRWYFYINSALWLPNRFHRGAVTEGQRKFMGTFWNTYAFFVLYANIDNFDATKYTLDYDKLTVMDKWLLSKLNTVVKTVDEHLESYRITEAARILDDFVDEMSNWYVRRSRERFWAKGMEQDKINAYMTLYTTLVTLAKVSAPFIPYMTEDIYRNLVVNLDKSAPESIHLCAYPTYQEEYIDKELEKNMEAVLEMVVLGRACRNAANIKNRQPIGQMYVKSGYNYTDIAGEQVLGLPEFYREIIEEELNVKAVAFTNDVRNFTSYSFKPQLKTLGPKFGKQIGQIRMLLSELDGNKAMDEINATGGLKVTLDGVEAVLDKEDLLIEAAQTEGYVSDSDKGVTVVLDTKLSKELIEEGFVREIISKIQTMRKDAGFEVMDHIKVSQSDNDSIKEIFERNLNEIKAEVLADEIHLGTAEGFTKEWNINGETVTLGVVKL